MIDLNCGNCWFFLFNFMLFYYMEVRHGNRHFMTQSLIDVKHLLTWFYFIPPNDEFLTFLTFNFFIFFLFFCHKLKIFFNLLSFKVKLHFTFHQRKKNFSCFKSIYFFDWLMSDWQSFLPHRLRWSMRVRQREGKKLLLWDLFFAVSNSR